VSAFTYCCYGASCAKSTSGGYQILWVCRKEYKSFYKSMRDVNG